MKTLSVHLLLAALVSWAIPAWGQTTQPATAASPATTAASQAVLAPAAMIVLQGTVDDQMQRRLQRHFEQARAEGARTIILEIDTYGGVAGAGLDMSRYLKNQTGVQTIAFVNSKAISAGAMLALACDHIIMARNATLGDAAPIAISPTGGLQTLGETERAKSESPILADFLDSARRNGYDPLLTQAMVRINQAIYWLEKDGHKRAADEKQYEALAKEGWRPVLGVPQPLMSANQLLTVHTALALELGLAEGTASSAAELAQQRGLRIVSTYAPSAGDHFIEFLGNPLVRFILLVVFLQSLYIAFHAPGHGMAEAVALMSLGALLGVPLLTGFAQWWEIIAILLGLALLALELFVIPGFGVAGISGIVLIVGGLILTFVGREPGGLPGILPQLQGTYDALLNGLVIVTGGLICSLLLSLWLRRYLPKLPYFSRLILTSVAGDTVPSKIAGTAEAAQDLWPFLGTTGVAVSDLRPGGVAEFPYGDLRRTTPVISDSGYLRAGTAVKVREISGNGVMVRSIDQDRNQ